jgi:hypothetical protein
MDLLDQFINLLQDFNDRLSKIGVTICDDGVLINVNDAIQEPAPVLKKDNAPFKPSPSKQAAKTTRWWSRYHFEKNLMTLAVNRLEEKNPSRWHVTTELAACIARTLDVEHQTAKRHITRAIKMGILVKRRRGNIFEVALESPEAIEESQFGSDAELNIDFEKDEAEESDILP